MIAAEMLPHSELRQFRVGSTSQYKQYLLRNMSLHFEVVTDRNVQINGIWASKAKTKKSFLKNIGSYKSRFISLMLKFQVGIYSYPYLYELTIHDVYDDVSCVATGGAAGVVAAVRVRGLGDD